jgi:hypothetical protein
LDRAAQASAARISVIDMFGSGHVLRDGGDGKPRRRAGISCARSNA